MSAVLTACIAAQSLASLAKELPNDGGVVLERMPALLMSNFLVALLVVLPAFALLALLISMPFVGAAYRLNTFLKATADGEQTVPCKLRTKDPLQDVCALMNAVTLGQRENNAGAQGEPTRDVA